MGQVKGCDDMNWFRRMMYGRYGNDQFGNFLFVVYLLLFVLQRIFIRTVAAPVFALVSMLVIVLYFFRCFSRNIVNRQRENQKFLKSPPTTVKRTPGPLAAFLRLFPLSVGLHRRRYLLRHKGDRKSQ